MGFIKSGFIIALLLLLAFMFVPAPSIFANNDGVVTVNGESPFIGQDASMVSPDENLVGMENRQLSATPSAAAALLISPNQCGTTCTAKISNGRTDEPFSSANATALLFMQNDTMLNLSSVANNARNSDTIANRTFLGAKGVAVNNEALLAQKRTDMNPARRPILLV